MPAAISHPVNSAKDSLAKDLLPKFSLPMVNVLSGFYAAATAEDGDVTKAAPCFMPS